MQLVMQERREEFDSTRPEKKVSDEFALLVHRGWWTEAVSVWPDA